MAAHNLTRGSFEEEAPLLSPTAFDAHAANPPQPPKKKKPWLLLVILIFLLLAIVDMGAFMAEPPKTRVFEANLCVRYYEKKDPSKIRADGTVDETLCKVNEVQQKMAMIFGWQDMFDAIPGILLAVPFGTLADKWGRKWIFVASAMGLQLGTAWILMICYFRTLPLQLTWFSSAFYVIGGGPMVATAMGITMVSDICPPEKRTSIFVYLTASVLVAELIAPILAAKLMEHGNWIPLILALALQQVGICIAFWFPETLHLRDLPEPKDGDEEERIELRFKQQGHGFKAQLRNFKDAFAFVRSDLTLALVVFTFLANRLGRQALTLLIRYASVRYSWKIAKASYLVSFRAATNLVALLVFIPGVSIVLLKYLRLPAHHADLWIARGSIILTTIAMAVMGIAAYPALLILGLLIFNMGTGYNAAMRSTAIHVVGGQSSLEIGRLMSVIAIIESIGTMLAGPLLNKSFDWAMDLGEPWIGLPFLSSALVFGSIAVVTFMISVKDKDLAYTEVDSDEPIGSESSHGSSSALERQSPRHSVDPDLAQQHALAAATTAFVRAQAIDAAEREKRGSSELSRTKSNASRKSLTSQGSHFPPRESSFRSLQQPQRGAQMANTRQSRASTMVAEKYPPFQAPPSMDWPLPTQPPITFNENMRPNSQPKPLSSSAASQQIRKARSMYYASSVQTGSPLPRPPAIYRTTPPPVNVTSTQEMPSTLLPVQTMAVSPLVSPRLPIIVAPDETVDKARDKYLQDFQQRQVKHKPSLFLAPFKKRQDKGKLQKNQPSLAGGVVHSRQYTPADMAMDLTLNDFQPQKDKKEKRSFSGSLKHKLRKVFRRTSNNATALPVQQIEASRDYFGNYGAHDSPSRIHGSFEIPIYHRPLESQAGRDIKRLTVIHEAKDSIGSETEYIITAAPKRKPPSIPAFAAFREPMPMESLVEEVSTPIDPKRVFSALMKEIDASKGAQVDACRLQHTSNWESDVFVSSASKDFQSSVTRELHSSASRDFQTGVSSDQRPMSRRHLESVAGPSKTSSIRSFGRALRSTIRTVTPSEQISSQIPDRTTSVRGAVRIPRPDTAASSSTTNSEVRGDDDADNTLSSVNFKMHCGRTSRPLTHETYSENLVTPTAEQIEQRVQKSKGRWKTPLEESHFPVFPRSVNRTFAVANIAQKTVSHQPSTEQIAVEESDQIETQTINEEKRFNSIPVSPKSPRPRPLFSPLSPSVYSRNTDGVSILPNDSVMSFDGANDEGGSAVIITSHAIKSYVIGTPSPHRDTHSARSSRDWKAWLSHEVSELENLAQEDFTIHGRYATPGGHHREFTQIEDEDTAVAVHSGSSSVNSKKTPSPKVYSDFSAPSTNRTSKHEPNVRSKRSEEINSDKENKKENVTQSLYGRALGVPGHGSTQSLPITKPKFLQPLTSLSSNRIPSGLAQYTTTATEGDAISKRNPIATMIPPRPRLRAQIRPISPGKLTTRPRSAFDLRGFNTPPVTSRLSNVPGPGSDSPRKRERYATGDGASMQNRIIASRGLDNDSLHIALEPRWAVSGAPSAPSSLEQHLRRPALHVKHSSSTLALNKEPSPGSEERGIDRVLGDEDRSGRESRGGSVTPGQRLAERFLRERSVGSGAASPVSIGTVTEDTESASMSEGLTPAFL
ncbi:MFS general substrate transporter [Melanomma pulvis-pyrius CBS 109.77]|uniref:MFS general substrate transporter n=1 Tax=Melanomma pulvis-pyrius CBS 109.77 TaxID=1314802 RepID=A0A6A6WU17_9PLEO|nr:MFS general substrate transporter [Melanomma pulvis-pyrius CBS 109.77]